MSRTDVERSHGVERARDDVVAQARRDELRELLLELRGRHRVLRIADADSRSRRCSTVPSASVDANARRPRRRILRREIVGATVTRVRCEQRRDVGVAHAVAPKAVGGELLERRAALEQRGRDAVREAELRLVRRARDSSPSRSRIPGRTSRCRSPRCRAAHRRAPAALRAQVDARRRSRCACGRSTTTACSRSR